ncbi:hypothetical protein DNTS_020277 [Danionella cerebrum]|uniref:Uncharacterized protein n=1 Tax=Danionella cerebrum TaxID=2873325 RepID=A0A553Q0E2_9TELE|nr:hypothetical protein DNTS_020277 [Danionella translucida]
MFATAVRKQWSHGLPNEDLSQSEFESVVNLISELQEQMCQIRQEISRKKPAEMILEGSKGLESEQSTAAEPKAAEVVMSGEQEQKLLQELRTLKHRVGELEQEKSHYEQKLKVTQAELTTLQQLLDCKNCEIDTLQAQLLSRAPVAVDAAERDTCGTKIDDKTLAEEDICGTKDNGDAQSPPDLDVKSSAVTCASQSSFAATEEIYRRRLNTKLLYELLCEAERNSQGAAVSLLTDQELLRLKTGMESLIAANDEKLTLEPLFLVFMNFTFRGTPLPAKLSNLRERFRMF